MDIISPLRTHARLDRLRARLVAYLAQSGMPLPEDENLLEFITTSMRFGNMRAALAVEEGDAVGVIAWRVEGDAGFIVLFCVLEEAPSQAAGRLLEEALCGLAGQAPRGIYVELPEVSDVVRAALEAADFAGVARTIMQCDVRALAGGDLPVLAPGYRLRAWDDAWLEAAADVIYRANIGAVDAMIIPEMQSLPGTLRIVRQALQGRYGLFDPAASGLILNAEGEAAGVTLVTRRHSGAGFTAEICVLPDHRRRGLARHLMLHTHAALRAAGVTHNTLGVTQGNPARRLYDSLGY
ncbi:MAG: GNAT family N-acetyltransferase, partial [Anaerolineae bacterium]|nr:GNAT family N-acetyltransferase [Anaerolineae bacterium]